MMMNNDFDIRDGVLYKYTGNSGTVVIPDSVYTIHEKAFRFCNTIKSVEIPNSVTRIEWGAFSFCENLECIKLPSSLEFISVSAIEGCTKLKTIVLENNEHYYLKDNKIISKSDETYVISTEIIK